MLWPSCGSFYSQSCLVIKSKNDTGTNVFEGSVLHWLGNRKETYRDSCSARPLMCMFEGAQQTSIFSVVKGRLRNIETSVGLVTKIITNCSRRCYNERRLVAFDDYWENNWDKHLEARGSKRFPGSSLSFFTTKLVLVLGLVPWILGSVANMFVRVSANAPRSARWCSTRDRLA